MLYQAVLACFSLTHARAGRQAQHVRDSLAGGNLLQALGVLVEEVGEPLGRDGLGALKRQVDCAHTALTVTRELS